MYDYKVLMHFEGKLERYADKQRSLFYIEGEA